MKARYIIGLCAGMILAGCADKEGKTGGVEAVRYSREMIEAHLHGWYNKDVLVAFPYASGEEAIPEGAVEASWDYVPGVVAKGILECWEYYQDSTWADDWYRSLCDWGLRQEATDRGGILDDLNCAKVYISLYEGAKPGGKYENEANAAYFMEQMRRAARGLAEHKALYSIKYDVRSTMYEEPEVNGGWMHKASPDPSQSYWGQMWCDGAYMGPALLAQLLAAGACEGTGLGWDDVAKQFTASWPYLWDEEKRLPYHVLFTDIKNNKNARALYEAGHLYKVRRDDVRCTKDNVPCTIYHSEEFWGRAAGWYMLALVDVLEAMPQGAEFDILHEYLVQLADGLVARQDKETGCWYQLLQYGPEKCVTQGVDATGSDKYTNAGEGGTQCNYLESSASCLITAALLKGTRLGLIDHAEAGKRGFEGIVRTFVRNVPSDDVQGTKEMLTITGSCQSAGLSKDRWGNAAYYLIGKDVPIQDNTEGKVLGAYLMAAVEYEREYQSETAAALAGSECRCLW